MAWAPLRKARNGRCPCREIITEDCCQVALGSACGYRELNAVHAVWIEVAEVTTVSQRHLRTHRLCIANQHECNGGLEAAFIHFDAFGGVGFRKQLRLLFSKDSCLLLERGVADSSMKASMA